MATTKTGKIDRPQRMTLTLTQSAALANVITQFPTSMTSRDRVGCEIIEVNTTFHSAALSSVFGASNYGVRYGLTQLYNSGSVPATPTEPGVIYWNKIQEMSVGTAASAVVLPGVIRHEFREPRLVHPASLFGFFSTDNVATALTIDIEIWYRYIDLTDEEFQEILQTIILQNAL